MLRVQGKYGTGIDYIYDAAYPSQVKEVRDDFGNWLRFSYAVIGNISTPRLVRVDASDGNYVEYSWYNTQSLLGVNYADGTTASFQPSFRQVVFKDTRYPELQEIKYDLYTNDYPLFNNRPRGSGVYQASSADGVHSISVRTIKSGTEPLIDGVYNVKITNGIGGEILAHVKGSSYNPFQLNRWTDLDKNLYTAIHSSGRLAHKIKEITNPLNEKITYLRTDALGNVKRITYPDGNYEEWQYTNAAIPIHTAQYRDRTGNITTIERHNSGHPYRITYPDGSTQEWTNFTPQGLPQSLKHSNGSKTNLTYDNAGRLHL
jgi:hypothetical protein